MGFTQLYIFGIGAKVLAICEIVLRNEVPVAQVSHSFSSRTKSFSILELLTFLLVLVPECIVFCGIWHDIFEGSRGIFRKLYCILPCPDNYITVCVVRVFLAILKRQLPMPVIPL